MFKLSLIIAVALTVVGCINHSDSAAVEDFGYTESVQVDDAMCDTDMDCVEKFGCEGIYAPNDTTVNYACIGDE